MQQKQINLHIFYRIKFYPYHLQKRIRPASRWILISRLKGSNLRNCNDKICSATLCYKSGIFNMPDAFSEHYSLNRQMFRSKKTADLQAAKLRAY